MEKYFLLVLFSFFASFAIAQEIVVEAARIDSERIDPSRSVTVVTSADIERMGVFTVAEVLRDIPGVQLTQQGPVGQTTSTFIRGARSEGTLVLVDGVEVNDASSPACGFDFSSLSASNIERIEVYRGPQSVRFGAGALGGVIHIVTKDGSAGSRFQTRFEGGSYKTRQGEFQISQKLESISYSTSIDGYRTAGFSAAAGGSESDSARIYSISSKGNWNVASATSISGNFRYTKADVDMDRGGSAINDDPNATSKASQFNAGLWARTRAFSDRLKVSVGGAISENSRQLTNDPDLSSAIFSRDHFWGRNGKAQAEADWLLGESHTLRFSVQQREEKGRSDSDSSSFGKTEISERSQSVAGKSITYLYENETWFADAGFRQDESSTLNAIQSYRASIGRNFTTGTKLTLIYGTGFKLPSLYQLYSSYGDSSLTAEGADTIDWTLEQKISNRSLLTATYFENRSRGMIDFNMATMRYYNVSRALSKGLELTLKVRGASGLGIDGTYTYLDAQDESTGLRLVRRPYNSAQIRFGCQSRFLEIYLGARYRGERSDIDPVSFNRVQNRSYTLWDIEGVVPASDGIKVNGRVENLFDREYQEVLGYGAPSRSFYIGLTGEI